MNSRRWLVASEGKDRIYRKADPCFNVKLEKSVDIVLISWFFLRNFESSTYASWSSPPISIPHLPIVFSQDEFKWREPLKLGLNQNKKGKKIKFSSKSLDRLEDVWNIRPNRVKLEKNTEGNSHKFIGSPQEVGNAQLWLRGTEFSNKNWWKARNCLSNLDLTLKSSTQSLGLRGLTPDRQAKLTYATVNL